MEKRVEDLKATLIRVEDLKVTLIRVEDLKKTLKVKVFTDTFLNAFLNQVTIFQEMVKP